MIINAEKGLTYIHLNSIADASFYRGGRVFSNDQQRFSFFSKTMRYGSLQSLYTEMSSLPHFKFHKPVSFQ